MTRDSDEWGPWIEHDGKRCRVPKGVVCETLHADGSQEISPSSGNDWSGWTWYAVAVEGKAGWAILKYRIRKPRALRQLRNMVENLPERERADT